MLQATPPVDIKKLKKSVSLRVFLVFVFLALMFFLPAGTIRYWEAWVYLTVLFTCAMFVIVYLFRRDPQLLERRMKMKEKEPEQKMIVKIGSVLFAVAFLVPGFDQRYGWSSVPLPTVLMADGFIVVGYLLFIRVLKENRYASRTIQVEEGQAIITTGPYAVVRHPMYVGAWLIYVFSPLALGSYWAMIASMMFTVILVVRVLNEEKVLIKELDGYLEYTRRTRYRLIPGIW